MSHYLSPEIVNQFNENYKFRNVILISVQLMSVVIFTQKFRAIISKLKTFNRSNRLNKYTSRYEYQNKTWDTEPPTD
jgi:hypothetical protein